jgi:RNA 3'-terminal phosphate cyclase
MIGTIGDSTPIMRETIMTARSVPLLILPMLLAAPASAQDGISNRDLRRAADAAIVSDIVRDRQAERDAARQPYASPGYGRIRTALGARNACSARALAQAGPGAIILGRPNAEPMSTGWEVEGAIGWRRGDGTIPFVCSVRNGSVSGVLLRR